MADRETRARRNLDSLTPTQKTSAGIKRASVERVRKGTGLKDTGRTPTKGKVTSLGASSALKTRVHTKSLINEAHERGDHSVPFVKSSDSDAEVKRKGRLAVKSIREPQLRRGKK